MTDLDRKQPAYVVWASYAILFLLFALTNAIGRTTTYLVLGLSVIVIATPSIAAAFRLRSRNPVDLLFLGAFVAMALAYAITMREPRDLLFAFNFAPFLLAIPFRWQIERLARNDGAALIAWLSLLGAALTTATGLIQTQFLHIARAGPPIMNAFQYADTGMLLGFVALAGLFSPGTRYRALFLLGPFFGVAGAILAGTRGALIAAPVLALIAIGFAFARTRSPRTIALAAAAIVITAGLGLGLAHGLGLDRAWSGFSAVQEAVTTTPENAGVDLSIRQRVVMYEGGLSAFLASPWVGYGFDHMVPAIYPYVPPEFLDDVRGFRHLHSGILVFGVSAGVIGLLVFFALSLAPIVLTWRSPRDSQWLARLYLGTTLAVAFGIFQLTYIVIGFEMGTVQYAFMLVAMLGFAQDTRSRAAAP